MSEMCAICGAPESSPTSLVEHMRTAHKHDDPASSIEMNPEAHTTGLVCALCGHRFPTAAALRDHNLGPHPESGEERGSDPIPA